MSAIKIFIIVISIFFFAFAKAQDYSRTELLNNIELAGILGMNDIWSQQAFIALPIKQRHNKVVDLERGVGIFGSMDREGYEVTTKAFLMAQEMAAKRYVDQVIAYAINVNGKLINMNDVLSIETVLSDSNDDVNMFFEYEVNAHEHVILSLICNDNYRQFIMAIK